MLFGRVCFSAFVPVWNSPSHARPKPSLSCCEVAGGDGCVLREPDLRASSSEREAGVPDRAKRFA